MKKIIPILLLLFIVTGCQGSSKEPKEAPFSTVNAIYSEIPKEVLTTEYVDFVKDNKLYLLNVVVTVKDNEFIEEFEMSATPHIESLYGVDVLKNTQEIMEKYFDDLVELPENQHFVKTYVLINPNDEIHNEIKSVSINYDNSQVNIDIGVYTKLANPK